jgi:TolB-like protein/cytochrome c-type biogenesis protein CcmH/NrfG
MPFANSTGNPDLEYLSDGITESIINALSQVPKLSVKGRSSVFRYKGKDVEPQQVGSDLKVQAVLNGRVLQHGDSMTIRLDLVDAATGNQIWGDQYDRKVTDLAALQNEISHDIAQKLSARLSGADQARIVKDQTQNSEAYQLYLQGRYFWNKRTPPATKTAIEFFQKAIEKDPNYAMAYVGLAEAYVVAEMPLTEAHDRSTAAANKALEIDPTLGEPHATIANYKNVYDQDYASAEQEFKRAIELNPNYATAYHWYGEFLVFQGRFDEGFAEYKKALELDPFSLAIGTDYGVGLAYARRFNDAIDQLNKLAEMDPSYVRTHTYLYEVYTMSGRYEDAIREKEKELNLSGVDPAIIAMGKTRLLDGLHSGGPKGYLSALIALMEESKKQGHPPSDSAFASVYAQLGDADKAFDHINRSIDSGEDSFIDLKVAPEWDKLRDDPRFIALLRKLNFTP